MPHLRIEYSSNLTDYPEAQALAEINAAVCASPEILNESDLKSRFMRTNGCFQIGTQPANRAFVHAQLRLLTGRSPETKKDLADRIADVLRRLTPRPAGMQVHLSVEIVDMDRASYVKESL
ncbi:MAG: 5-carboxymethyl-2-hydroxymuconate Delta-isomerase [Pseudomonadota bacterium]|nr:5-carboxymethyl-2-hydroxymuconate Delta-isomerase [Pseudomonadota bacterium]